jgi:hypothetical protein
MKGVSSSHKMYRLEKRSSDIDGLRVGQIALVDLYSINPRPPACPRGPHPIFSCPSPDHQKPKTDLLPGGAVLACISFSSSEISGIGDG